MAAAAVRRIILGTAGHIDHGKTSLVKRLTASEEADRLPEERTRGMTIDIGYATFMLPDGTEAGLLDVPGHESFVHTMVAGATAMDVALLVVAADDGPMPQTREHIEILDVLGVNRLVVALTKIDLVDADMVELATEAVNELVETTSLKGAPVVPVSSETGEGFDALKKAIVGAIPKSRKAKESRFAFRMPILRRFDVAGRGVVVTGIPLSGHIAVGDGIEIQPIGAPCRVRSIQVHHREAEEARAGHRTAMAISDVKASAIRRGMVVSQAGLVAPTTRLVARLDLLESARKPIQHRDRVRLHLGASQTVAQVHLPLRKAVPPGSSEIVELQAVAPVIALPGDAMVLREENAASTLGGGVVIEPLARRLPSKRQGLIDRLRDRTNHLDSPKHLVEAIVEAAGMDGLLESEITKTTSIVPKALSGLMQGLAGKNTLRPIGRSGRWIAPGHFGSVRDRIVEVVKRLHTKDEAVDSLPIAQIRSSLGRIHEAVFDEALRSLTDDGELVRTAGGTIYHHEHSSELPPKDKAVCERVINVLAKAEGRPPSEEDLAGLAGISSSDLKRALRLLAARNLILRAEPYWFEGAWVEQSKLKLAEIAKAQGGFSPADARSALDTTRKWIIPLLEALDKTGFSRRAGSKRVLRSN